MAGPGDEHTSSRRFLFVDFGVGQEHLFALLIIMNNVNLRITTSISFFEGGRLFVKSHYY